MDIIIPAIIFLLIGLAIGFFLGKSQQKETVEGTTGVDVSEHAALQANFDQLAKQLSEQRDQVAALHQAQLDWSKRESQLESDLKHEREKLEEEKKRLQRSEAEQKEAAEQLKKEFRLLAGDILKANTKDFKAANTEELDKLLKPFKEQLSNFEKRVEETHKEDLEKTAALKEQLKSLQEMNQSLNLEAQNLTKALEGSKTQGNWGEYILERALEMSGLIKDREFFIQNSGTTEEGKRLQPDVVVQLPANKHVVIDSKVSLTHWNAYVSAETPEEAENYLKQHVNSIKQHVKDLSGKDYTQLYDLNSLDFVLLFIPIEPAFIEATKAETQLYDAAFSKNIILVSNSTLLATLKTIAIAWRHNKQNDNVMKIAAAGGKLYDKFAGLLDDFNKMGKQLGTVGKTYNDSMRKLSGNGGIMRQVENLKTLGSATKKDIGQHEPEGLPTTAMLDQSDQQEQE